MRHVCPVGQAINRLDHLGAEGIGRVRTALEVPEEGHSELPLGFWQNLDSKPSHIAIVRARTSDQAAPFATPA